MTDYMRIGVLMMYDAHYERMAGITIDKNVRQYCELHGYRLFAHKINGDENDRPPQWQKIAKSIEILESGEVDWLLFLDLDCLVMNSTIKIESLIDDAYSLILPAHAVDAIDFPMEDNGFGGNNIISAMYLVKADEMGLAILRDVWNKNGMPEDFDSNKFDYEQRQFRITLSNPEFRKHAKIVEERKMNTSWYINNPFMLFSFPGANDLAWKPGDFIAHVTGYDLDERIRILSDLNFFSGGDVAKIRMQDDRVIFSPLCRIPYTMIVIKEIGGEVLNKCAFTDCLEYRMDYFMTIPHSVGKVIFEAYDSDGKMISSRIAERH